MNTDLKEKVLPVQDPFENFEEMVKKYMGGSRYEEDIIHLYKN
jgi:hypothetical protein